MSSAAVLHYFRSIADRSPLPVVLYNIPKCVPYQIPIELIAELANHPNIIGIKDSSGSVDRIRATVAATQNAPRRTVPVTQVFEAVTLANAQTLPPSHPARSFRPATWPAAQPSPQRRPPSRSRPAAGKSAFRFFAARPARFFGRSNRSYRRHPRLCRLRSAGLPGNLPRVEGSRPRARRREAAAHCSLPTSASSAIWESPESNTHATSTATTEDIPARHNCL